MKYGGLLAILLSVIFAAIVMANEVLPPNDYGLKSGLLLRPELKEFIPKPRLAQWGYRHLPYRGCRVDTVGATTYDMQHNTTTGRNIAVDDSGGIHIAWMHSQDFGWTGSPPHRHIHYNYISIPLDTVLSKRGTILQWGSQADPMYKAGYCNITLTKLPNVMNPSETLDVPFIAYHGMKTAASDFHTHVSWDVMYRLNGTELTRGSFSISETSPSTARSPDTAWSNSNEYETYYPDLVGCSTVEDLLAIWPKIDADNNGNIYIIATPSSNDTLCGVPVPDYVVFWKGSPVFDASGFITTYDYTDALLLDFSLGINADIAVDRRTGKVAVGYISIFDTVYCGTGTDRGASWSSLDIGIRTSTDGGTTWSNRIHVLDPDEDGMYEPSDFDTLFFPTVIGTILASGDTMYYTWVDTFSGVWKPAGYNDISLTFDPSGNVHAVFSAFLVNFYSLTDPCTLGIWYGSGVLHWSQATGDYSLITAGIPNTRPTYVEGNYGGSYLVEFMTSVRPSIAIDDTGTIYVVWEQAWPIYYELHDSLWRLLRLYPHGTTLDSIGEEMYQQIIDSVAAATEGMFDMSANNVANYEIFLSYSSDGGRTWHPRRNISYTNSPQCAVDSCLCELDISVARKVDNYLHIFAVLDKDAGKYLKAPAGGTNGEITADPILHIAVPTICIVRDSFPEEGIKEAKSMITPTTPKLVDAYPNPFNAAVNLVWKVPEAGNIKAEILDISGRVVKTIRTGYSKAGEFSAVWDGTDEAGKAVPSGSYVFKLTTEKATSSMVLKLVK